MSLIIICLVAMFASLMTLFSGFGLGTLLLPAVALFFPIEIAVAMTAVVHLANNGFKLALMGRHTNFSVLFRFGFPAVVAAFMGAWLLIQLADLKPLFSYQGFDRELQVAPIKLVIGLLILSFVCLELSGVLKGRSLNIKYLPFGGLVSGFFGGLSGHQGAFRSLFLLQAGLSKEAFIATGVSLAVLVDISRLSIYGWSIKSQTAQLDWALIGCACLASFLGAYIGKRLLQKVTIESFQRGVSLLLLLVAIGLISGMI